MGRQVEIKGDVRSFESLMILIPKENWFFSPSMMFPIVECPHCGCGMLGDPAPHGIHADGRVYNSVVCESCDFHNYIKLEEWNGRAIPRGKKI